MTREEADNALEMIDNEGYDYSFRNYNEYKKIK
jgi:hypothetical protein